jgi:hypothetical protein
MVELVCVTAALGVYVKERLMHKVADLWKVATTMLGLYSLEGFL